MVASSQSEGPPPMQIDGEQLSKTILEAMAQIPRAASSGLTSGLAKLRLRGHDDG